jgi:transcriptional regulator with XRE-family HTH domain
MTADRPVGVVIRQRREALGLSQAALGTAAGEVSSATIGRIERGERKPHRSTIAAISQALELPVNGARNESSRDITPGPLKEEADDAGPSPT